MPGRIATVDISKLPKLSKAPADQAEAEPAVADPPPQQPSGAGTPPPSRRPTPDYRQATDDIDALPAVMWFNVIVGIIFLLMGQRFGGYALAKLSHQPYHTKVNWMAGPKAGQEVEYFELEGKPALDESAKFLFGLAVLADTALCFAIFRRSRLRVILVGTAFAITALATGYNLYVAGVLQSMGVLPLISLLAVAFGGYMAFQQWTIIKAIRGHAARR